MVVNENGDLRTMSRALVRILGSIVFMTVAVGCQISIGGLPAGGSSASSSGTTYSVTYKGNGNTGGSVPVDSNKYTAGSTVTVLANSGNLAKSGDTFVAWNTRANGSGADYPAGTTFTMGSANVTLYAEWTNAATYTVTYNGNGSVGGNVPVDPNNYLSGASVTVLGNTGGLLKTPYVFSGWNTAANGSGTAYQPGATLTIGSANVTLYAQWTAEHWLTYDGNGNTGGSGPVGYVYYPPGTSVQVSGIGSLVRNGFIFEGWNTSADGSGATYSPGAYFTMGNANVTLYAYWESHLYEANAGSNSLSSFAIGPTGALSSIGTNSTGSGPTAVAISPNAKYLYVVDTSGNSVTAYSINSTTNALTGIGTYSTGTEPTGLAISPNGNFLYVTNGQSYTLSAFSIATGGALTSIGTYSTGVGPVGVAISPNGDYLYVTNSYNSSSGNSISAYSLNSSTGALSSVGTYSTGTEPYGIAISPNGDYVYVANHGSTGTSGISAYSIDAGGALSLIGTYSTGVYPEALVITPSGSSLYVTNTANSGGQTVSAFSIGSTGALASIGTYSTGAYSEAAAISPDGRYLYVTNQGSNTISTFSVGSSGALSSMGTVNVGSAPRGIVIMP